MAKGVTKDSEYSVNNLLFCLTTSISGSFQQKRFRILADF